MNTDVTMDDVDVAIELAHNCVRNNTILEDIHADGGISEEEMKTLMEDIIANLVMYIKNPEMTAIHWYSGLFKAPPEWYKNKERYNERNNGRV